MSTGVVPDQHDVELAEVEFCVIGTREALRRRKR
jgi:hypothetical protein